MTFDEAFERLLEHEGGYANDSADRGGETKYGISSKAYPHVNVKSLTKEQAKAIYKADFWDAVIFDETPRAIRFALFDMAVNSGVSFAAKQLQKALGTYPDGDIGPVTRRAMALCGNGLKLANRLHAQRLMAMTSMPTWGKHGKGWARRVAENILWDNVE